jgi:hypothetical protein
MHKNTNNKQVSFKVDSNVYAVLKVYADLDERSVRNWFERYIKSTFEKEYNSLLNGIKPDINTGIKPNINTNSGWAKIDPDETLHGLVDRTWED